MRLHFVLLLTVSPLLAQDDPVKDIRSKDVATRLHAVTSLTENDHPKSEQLLLKACKDKDWEVVLRTAEGLARRGGKKSLKPLIDLAVKHPLTAIRQSAARALRSIDPGESAKKLGALAKGNTRVRAAEALVIVGDPTGWKRFEKMTKSEDATLVRVGVLGLAGTGDERAPVAVAPFLSHQNVGTRAAAARALVRVGNDAALQLLLRRLAGGSTQPVMERRIVTAVLDILEARDDGLREAAVELCTKAFEKANDTKGKGACARLLGRLRRDGDAAGKPEAPMLALLSAAASSNSEVTAAIAVALGRIGGERSFEALAKLAKEETNGSVRFHAVRAAAATEEKGVGDLLVHLLSSDAPVLVREECAVACGRGLLTATAPALRTALSDGAWRIVLAAAISLGKLQHEPSIVTLAGLLEHDDFKIRAAGAAGLGLCGRKAVVDHLIGALGDKDPLVRDTALDYLRRLTRNRMEARPARWKRWWASNNEGFIFTDRLAGKRVGGEKKKDDGYDRFRGNPYDSFRDFLVIVLAQSRDKMEQSLDALEIEHVLTRTGKVHESKIQPNAAFLANCPGDVNGDDAARLEWFVRSGGHLFSTCVALSGTVRKVFPGVLRLPPRPKSAPGAVSARPVDTEQDYLNGVFDDHARPLYQLAGHQLPVAEDLDRVHVLIDSADACTLWGSGNLAAWFNAGHGVVVHSANHFVLQGMERLKSAAERKAFALERLGINFRRLRQLEKKGVFKSQSKAAKACRDETMMRLIARFIYTKRRNEY